MMLWKKVVSLSLTIIFLCFLFPITRVFAHIISISAISPFPATVPVSSTATATFRVTNTTSKVPLTVIDQSQFPEGSGLYIIANTCGRLMAAGQSCTITVGLHAPSRPQRIFTKLKEWAKPSADGVTFPFSVKIVDTPPPPVSPNPWVAAGEDFSSPLLAVSTDGTDTWSTKSIAGLPSPTGSFQSTTCIGGGTDAICAIVGRSGLAPVLSISADGGNSWAVKNIVGLPLSGIFFSVGCTGNDTSAICSAVGKNFTANTGLLVTSIDGTNNWTIGTIPGLPAGSLFNSTNCVGSTSSAICTAAGYYTNAGQRGLLAVSTNGTASWTLPSIAGLPALATFYETSCTGSGSNAICTAAGYAGFPADYPLIVASLDGGNTWAVAPITNAPAHGVFNAINCTGSGVNAICVAVGTEDPSFTPLLVTSTDGGNTWARETIPSPTVGEFLAVSCTGNGSSAICAAVGQEYAGSFPPIVVVSTDGGATWIRKSITGLPTDGVFMGVKCTGTGTSATCVAGGEDNNGAAPALLAVSTDATNTWEVKTVTGLPPSGVYYGIGSGIS